MNVGPGAEVWLILNISELCTSNDFWEIDPWKLGVLELSFGGFDGRVEFKIICILGGWANSVVELKTLDDIAQYAWKQCQVTKYS